MKRKVRHLLHTSCYRKEHSVCKVTFFFNLISFAVLDFFSFWFVRSKFWLILWHAEEPKIIFFIKKKEVKVFRFCLLALKELNKYMGSHKCL